MTLLFLDAEILAGTQKNLAVQTRKNPKTSPRKKWCWGVSIPKHGPIIYRAVSALSAWDLRVRMFISLISYVLYVLSTRHHKLEKKEGCQKKRKVNAGLFCGNSHWILRILHCITVVHCEYPNYCEILLS